MPAIDDFSAAFPDAPKVASAPSDGSARADFLAAFPDEATRKLPQPEKLGFFDRLLSSIPTSVANNPQVSGVNQFMDAMAAPGTAIAQAVANVPGIRSIQVKDPTLSDLVKGQDNSVGATFNRSVTKRAQDVEADAKAYAGQPMFPGLGMVIPGADQVTPKMTGEVLNPANLLLARLAPTGASFLGRVGAGATVGGASGLLTPVNDAADNFWLKKAAQGTTGAVTGAILNPLIGGVADLAVRKITKTPNIDVDKAISESLEAMGQKPADIPSSQMDQIRAQVAQAVKGGSTLDPAALLRKSDFEAANIPALTGQLTRDPAQFANERNLRGVAGVGEPIQGVLDMQNQGLQKQISAFGSDAGENYNAAKKIAAALQEVDAASGRNVSALYTAARNSAGKDLEVPLTGVAQDYASTLDRFGDKVPSGVRNQFNALGLDPASPSNQKKIFTMDSADKLLKTINDNVGIDPATNKALSELRDSIKGAVTSVDASGGPFAPAVAAARQRFAIQDATPAIKAATDAPADTFVRRYVVGAPTDDVKNLVKALQKNNDALQEVKSQVGAHLERAAFGENVAGDKNFAPERYAKAIRDLGTEKLNAIFDPSEVDAIKRLSRVGSYINQPPGSAPVNFSNSGSAIANMTRGGIGMIPGGKVAMGLFDAGKTAAVNRAGVQTAIGAEVPLSPNIDEAARRLVAKLVAAGVFSAAGLASQK